MRVVLNGMLGATVVLILLTRAVAADVCTEVRQQHRLGSFHFETSAASVPHPRADTVLQLITCVSNKGSSDLWIDWYVPGPRTWILAGETLKNYRLAPSKHAFSISGCLEYGNLAQVTYAHFIGTELDRVRSDNHDRNECRAAGVRTHDFRAQSERQFARLDTKLGSFEKLFVPVTLRFPSDSKRPYETMLSLTGEIGTVFSEKGISYFFDYHVRSVEGRLEGKITDVTVRYSGGASEFEKPFLNPVPRIRPALEPTRGLRYTIEALVPLPAGTTILMVRATDNFQFQHGSYEFVDIQGVVVAAVQFPIFVHLSAK